jgi:YbgC/YbaW family acyl-CoA thioester hydrolase
MSVQLLVMAGDYDTLGHVNNAVYFNYLEQALAAALADLGFVQGWRREGSFDWRLSERSIEYREPAVFGDRLLVDLWLAHADPPRRSSAVRSSAWLHPMERSLARRYAICSRPGTGSPAWAVNPCRSRHPCSMLSPGMAGFCRAILIFPRLSQRSGRTKGTILWRFMSSASRVSSVRKPSITGCRKSGAFPRDGFWYVII